MSCADPSRNCRAGPPEPAAAGIFAEIARLQRAGRRAVLAVPIWTSGSVPLSAHSKLLFRDDGSIKGTVGGGRLEAEVLAAAPAVLKQDRHRVLEFDLTGADAAETGMICGGRCAVLLEPIAPSRGADVFAAAAHAEISGEPIVIMTILLSDAPPGKLALTSKRCLVGAAGDSHWADPLLELADQSLSDGRPRFAEDPVSALIYPLLPRPSLFIFGAGHIGVCLAHLADIAGFRVVVADDRKEFANAERFPRADQVLVATVADAFSQLRIAEDCYLVAVTRGHASDEEVVARGLATAAKYIGMIGSKAKVAAVRHRLRARGFPETDIARLHAPIGLDIGAETVEEIAVSILAQLIAVRRGVS